MNNSQSNILRQLLTTLLLVLMALASHLLSTEAVIFPELAALCVGLWVVDKRVWAVPRWAIVPIMTVGALLGIGVVRAAAHAAACGVAVPLALQLLAGYLLAVGLLTLFRARLVPVVASVMLAILVDDSSWIYPVAVSLMTALVVLGQMLLERASLRQPLPQPLELPSRKALLQTFSKLSVPLAVWLAVVHLTGAKLMVVPPLVVMYVELCMTKGGLRQRFLSTGLLMAESAVVGAASLWLFVAMGLPVYLSPLLTMAVVLLIFRRRGKYFAPAAALSMVPLLIGVSALPAFVLQAALGTALVVLLSHLYSLTDRQTINNR